MAIMRVRVVPNSRRRAVERVGESELRVKVDASPSKGRANGRLIEIIAEYFGVATSRVRIVAGAGRRDKLVEISAERR